MAGGWEGAGNGPDRKPWDLRTQVSGHTPPPVDFRTTCRHSGANPSGLVRLPPTAPGASKAPDRLGRPPEGTHVHTHVHTHMHSHTCIHTNTHIQT